MGYNYSEKEKREKKVAQRRKCVLAIASQRRNEQKIFVRSFKMIPLLKKILSFLRLLLMSGLTDASQSE